jgi:hypothetical protein
VRVYSVHLINLLGILKIHSIDIDSEALVINKASYIYSIDQAIISIWYQVDIYIYSNLYTSHLIIKSMMPWGYALEKLYDPKKFDSAASHLRIDLN